MSLSRTVSEINGDFSRKSQIFPTPVSLTPPLSGFSLEYSRLTPDGLKNWSDGAATQQRIMDELTPCTYLCILNTSESMTLFHCFKTIYIVGVFGIFFGKVSCLIKIIAD